jgi:phosphoribosylformylglycinamidine (FGAM) synthase-like enzyme
VPAVGIFRDDFLLFSESQSRFVVTIREKDLQRFAGMFPSVPFGVIGRVGNDERFLVRGTDGRLLIDIPISALMKAWQAPFKEHFNG